MAEPRAAWGIDIGQAGLKALKVRYLEGPDQVVAEAFDYIPFPKILSQPDAIPEEIVPQAMATFLSRNQLKGDLVAISVPGQSALARFIQLPPVEAGKIHEIVKYEARQQIPFALEDVIWDYQPLGVGMEESGFLLDAEVGLFAMKRDQVFQQLRPYNNAKVEVELIQIAPLALYNVLAFDELGLRPEAEAEAGEEYYIMLDMGCDNTTLMVSNGFKIWIRNVPIGGNHFTRALTKEMKLSFAKAEHLKCNATKSPDPRAVFQALRPVFNDYVSEIQRSIGFFSSVNRSAKIVKVIGMGNGFKLAGLQKFLQQNLQYEVVRPDSFKGLAGDAVLNSPLFSENILSFGVPYGLCVQALGLSRIHTSLLPPEIRQARLIRRKKPWALATAAALLVGFSLSTAVNGNSFRAVNTPEFANAEAEATKFVDEVGSLRTNYEGEIGRYEKTRATLDSLTKGRRDVSWAELFNAVIDCLPQMDEDEAAAATEIEQKKIISITEFSSDRLPDVSSWFNRLGDRQKEYMSAEDRENAPSGDAYIVTVRGEHYVHDSENPTAADLLFVADTLLNNLQQPTVQRPGFPERDVTRLGVSHAVLVEQSFEPVMYSPTIKPQSAPSRFETRGVPVGPTGTQPNFGADPAFGGGLSDFEGIDPTSVLESLRGGGAPGGLPFMPPGMDGADVRQLQRTRFVIQFVYKPTPPEERGLEAADGEEAADAEGAATLDD